MKTKHLLILCASGLALFTVGFILNSIKGLLPSIAIKLLLALLVLAAIALCYLFFAIYERIHAKRHQIRMRNHDHQVASQQLAIEQGHFQMEQERWQVERAALLLAQQHAATRIYPDTKGYMPTVVSITESEGYQYLQLPHPVHQGRLVDSNQGQQALPEHAQSRQDENAIPTAPPFRAMWHLLNGESLPLCWTATGPLFGTILDLLSMAVTGKPGRGKTTALMYYVAILLSCGAEVTIWDPHGVMGELATLNGRVLPNMPATARVYYYDRKEDIIASLPGLEDDLNERDELYRPPQRQVKHPHLLLADELPLLAEFDEELKAKSKRAAREGSEETTLTLIRTIKRYVLEARKWNCYFIGSGQSMDAEILPTRVTENLASRIIFFSSDRRARMAGLENEAIKRYLPIIRRAGSGVMVFDCARFDEPVLGAIPMITIEDLMEFLGLSDRSRLPEMEALAPNPVLRRRDVYGTPGTPHYIEAEAEIDDDPDAQNDVLRGDSGPENTVPANVRTFPNSGVNRLMDTSDVASEERPKEYRLSEQEIQQFIAAYKAVGNIDKALAAIGRGARYRAHASEIVNAYGLRQNA